MKKDESHTQAVRERLKMLLHTYEKELKVNPVQAETGETVIEQGGEALVVELCIRDGDLGTSHLARALEQLGAKPRDDPRHPRLLGRRQLRVAAAHHAERLAGARFAHQEHLL